MNINPIEINTNFNGINKISKNSKKFSQEEFNNIVSESKNLTSKSLDQYAQKLSEVNTDDFDKFITTVNDPLTQTRLRLHKSIVDKYKDKLNLLIKICNRK